MIQKAEAIERNVLGGQLEPCCRSLQTGYFRDGSCRAAPDDRGLHVVCAQMTAEFLEFGAARGNDLRTARPDLGFPGLVPGDRWCLCAARWKEALDAGVAPPVVLEATHAAALVLVTLEELRRFALAD